MDKKILYEILNSKSEMLSKAEIEGILNEELDKSLLEMDTDLVDLCLEVLNNVDDKKIKARKKNFNLSKILIAAIIFLLVLGISIPACAKFFKINVPKGIVEFYNDCFHINLYADDSVKDIYAQLFNDGIDKVILPKIVFEPNAKLTNYSLDEKPENSTITFLFSTDDISGYITIEKYKSYSFINSQNKVSDEFNNISQIQVNGISVLVFCDDNISYINYNVDNVEYNIVLNCDYNQACEIAKTI